jgi:hypothetical protein
LPVLGKVVVEIFALYHPWLYSNETRYYAALLPPLYWLSG